MNLIARYQGLLALHGCNEQIIAHATAVTNKAIEILNRVSIPVDRKLVIAGAMLHDIGRCKTHGIDHVIVGGAIASAEGMPERIVRIIERHVGAGLKADEAVQLGLPERDFMPVTPEEIVVSYSDNLTSGSKSLSFEEALARFESKLGSGHVLIERFKKQHEQIQLWTQGASEAIQ